jgi:hypothetical protein
MALSPTLREGIIALVVAILAIVFVMLFVLYVPRWAYFKIKNHPRIIGKSHSKETKAWWTEGVDALANLKAERARQREERRLEMEKIEFDEDLERAEEHNSWRMNRPMPAFVAPWDGWNRGRF